MCGGGAWSVVGGNSVVVVVMIDVVVWGRCVVETLVVNRWTDRRKGVGKTRTRLGRIWGMALFGHFAFCPLPHHTQVCVFMVVMFLCNYPLFILFYCTRTHFLLTSGIVPSVVCVFHFGHTPLSPGRHFSSACGSSVLHLQAKHTRG